MTASAAAAELRALADRVRRGEAAGAEVQDAAARAVVAARSGAAREILDLSDALAELQDAVFGELDRLAALRRRAGQERTALGAYGALRPFTRGQRLRRRV